MAIIQLVQCNCGWYNLPGQVCRCMQLPEPTLPAIDIRPDPDAHLGAVRA